MASQVEIAKHLDLTIRPVRDMMTDGRIPKGGSLDECRVAYIRHLRERAARWVQPNEGSDPPTGELELQKTRLTKAQADEKELQVKALRESLIPAEEVELEWSSMIANARAKLLSLPSKAASQVLAAKDRIEAEEILRTMVNEALAELAQGGEDEADTSPESENLPGLDTTAPPDGQPVGKRKPETKRRGQLGTGPVLQRESTVPNGDHGRNRRSPGPRVGGKN